MSEAKNNKNTEAQQANSQPSYAGKARESWKSALQKSAAYTGDNISTAEIHTKADTALFGVQAVAAGGKDYGQALSNSGKSIMQGARQQSPNDGQQLNNMKINQAISEDSKASINKGIESARQKAADKQSTENMGKTSNHGIQSFQSKASGQSSNTSKGNSNIGKSGGSSNDGQSSGSSQGSSR